MTNTINATTQPATIPPTSLPPLSFCSFAPAGGLGTITAILEPDMVVLSAVDVAVTLTVVLVGPVAMTTIRTHKT